MRIDESYLARRRFLCGMLGGGATALATGVVGPLLDYVGDFQEAAPPEFLALDQAEYNLLPGQAKMLFYGQIPVLMFRPAQGDSSLKVFAATCTHLGCIVAYQEKQNRIHCACHNGCFDTEGRVVSGPPPRALQQLYTKLSGGKLIIAMEKECLEKAS